MATNTTTAALPQLDSGDLVDDRPLVYDYATGDILEVANADEVYVGCAVCGHKTGRRGRYRTQTKHAQEAIVCSDACDAHWRASVDPALALRYSAKVGVDTNHVRTAARPTGELGLCVACGVMPAQIATAFHEHTVGVCSHHCQDMLDNEHRAQHTVLGEHMPLSPYTHEAVNVASVLAGFAKQYDTKVVANQLYALRREASENNGRVAELVRAGLRPQVIYWMRHARPMMTDKGVDDVLRAFAAKVQERLVVLGRSSGLRDTFGNVSGLFVGEIDRSVISNPYNVNTLARHLSLAVIEYMDDPVVRGAVLVRTLVGRVYRMLWNSVGQVGDFLNTVFTALGTPTSAAADEAVVALVGGPLDALKNKAKSAVTKAKGLISLKPYNADALAAELINVARVVACFTEKKVQPETYNLMIVNSAAYQAWAEGIWPHLVDAQTQDFKASLTADVLVMLQMLEEFKNQVAAAVGTTSGKFNAQRDCKPGSRTTNPSAAGKNWYGLFTHYKNQKNADKKQQQVAADFKKIIDLIAAELGVEHAKSFLRSYLQALTSIAKTVAGV